MDFLDRLCRELQVPEVIRPENRLQAVAVKVARQCGIPIPERSEERARCLAAVASVITATVTAADGGRLDPLLGEYDEVDVSAEIARRPPKEADEELSVETTEQLSAAVIDLLVKHVRDHPMEDRERLVAAITSVFRSPPATSGNAAARGT